MAKKIVSVIPSGYIEVDNDGNVVRLDKSDQRVVAAKAAGTIEQALQAAKTSQPTAKAPAPKAPAPATPAPAATQPVVATPPDAPTAQNTRAAPKRSRKPWAIGAGVLVTIALGAWFILSVYHPDIHMPSAATSDTTAPPAPDHSVQIMRLESQVGTLQSDVVEIRGEVKKLKSELSDLTETVKEQKASQIQPAPPPAVPPPAPAPQAPPAPPAPPAAAPPKQEVEKEPAPAAQQTPCELPGEVHLKWGGMCGFIAHR